MAEDPVHSSIASIPDVSLILNETVSLVASMRKQARWSTSSVAAILGGAVEANLNHDADLATRWGLRGSRAAVSDNPLLAGFSRLRQDLLSVDNISDFDTAALLGPFLAVVRSSTTTGAITSLALNSISKFFSYRLINAKSENLAEAMRQLSSAVTHCRFEASDSGQQDEVVLLRILTLMQEMMSGVGGDLLSDESVCEMMETGLSMCCQMRLSEMLRRSAEMTMSKMVQVVFLRLKQMDPKQDEFILNSTAPSPVASPKMDPVSMPGNAAKLSIDQEQPTETIDTKLEDTSTTSASETANITVAPEPYGITSIRELLRVLISILNPAHRQHTDSMRVMALRVIEVALEIGGLAIAERPTLRALATDDLCRFLFQSVKSANHIVLQSSLRVISTLLYTMRIHLKLQQELFLNYVVACLVPRPEALKESGIDPSIYEALPVAPKIRQLTSGRATPVPVKDRQKLGLEGGARGADAREVMIECIGSLVRIPTFMIDLFVNYDCEENLSDLCEDVLGFLCRNAFPDAAIWSTTNVPPLCLDALLSYISLLHSRLHSRATQSSENMPNPSRLNESRRRKELVVKACARFNEKPKEGIKFMRESNIIDFSDETEGNESLARFLFSSDRIDKALLGDFISRPDNVKLLAAFIRLFDFRDKRIDEALREMLQKFRLPGESQQISRIVDEFSVIYYSSGTTDVENADSAHILSYAIIMLNTDQHNPQARRSRMTSQQFAQNLRGTNNGKNFRPEFLQEIFDQIKNNEIIMLEEHDTSASFDYAWKELLARKNSAGRLTICETNLYDEAMFRATWRPLVATLSYVFQSATDDAVFSRVIGGLSQCAKISAHYGINDVMDEIVLTLSNLTLLAEEQLPGIEKNTSVEVDKQQVTVSELGVAFGREFKAQLAMVILFRICNGNERVIRHGWKQLFDIFSALLINSMLPIGFSPLHQFMNISPIPLPPPNRASKSFQRNQESSFFNSLSSYLSSYTSDEPPQPTSEEIESTMCTFDCISSCRLDHVSANIMSLDETSTTYLVDFLLQHQESSPAKKAMSSLLAAPAASSSIPKIYDPARLLKIEMATAIALKDARHTELYAQKVLDSLSAVIQTHETSYHLMTERALVYAMRIYQAILENGQALSFTLTDDLSKLNDEILSRNAVPIAWGILNCLQVDSGAERLSNNQEIYKIISRIRAHPDVSSLIFEIVTKLANVIDIHNYSFIVSLLDSFATEGHVGSQDEQFALQAKKSAHTKHSRGQAIKGPAPSHKDEVQRACRAIELLSQLRQDAYNMSSSDDTCEQHVAIWSPLLISLREQCLNPCQEVAKYAFTHLQRVLLSIDLSDTRPSATVVFDTTLLTLLEKLQDPAMRQLNYSSIDNKVQTSSLLCKVWLHHLSSVQKSPDATAQWSRILTGLIKLMKTSANSSVTEAVTESIKNVLLVMASAGMLREGQETYIGTAKTLKSAHLDIMTGLFGSDDMNRQAVPADANETKSATRVEEHPASA